MERDREWEEIHRRILRGFTKLLYHTNNMTQRPAFNMLQSNIMHYSL